MPSTTGSRNLVICIQCIQTYWDKSARGGLEAETRNRVPEKLKLPPCQTLDAPLSYLIHRAYFSKSNIFAEPVKNTVETTLTEPRNMGGVSLSFLEAFLTANYKWKSDQGAPPRYSGSKEAFRLSVGQWGCILYNGRHTDYDNGTWFYDKWVYNIGLFVSPSPSVFLKTEPVEVASYMALLR